MGSMAAPLILRLLLAVAAGAVPRPAAPGGYLVALDASLAGTGYERAARRLSEARRGRVVTFDSDEALAGHLRAERPAFLALVLAPAGIDANLPRRLVPRLASLDDDPFVDTAFGIITGTTGDDADRFVRNILRVSARDLPATMASVTSVSVPKCTRVGPRPEPVVRGRVLDTVDLWVTGADGGWRDFLEAQRAVQTGRGLVEWGHCGDPQGIWLFSMMRNRERERHWPFDPRRVGEDPRGEMPRLTPALLLRDVELHPAVVVNGSCHSAVTSRAMVGGDIVSTFGDTGGVVRWFDLRPGESFPLMAIRKGATAYIAPLAANNANRAALDLWWIARGGLPLGEVMRRSLDELVLGSRGGRLAFGLFEEGRPAPAESPMWADTVHRVLFGDPAHVPWKDAVPTSHEATVKRDGAVLMIRMVWTDLGRDPWVWDPWVEDRTARELGRMIEWIPLDGKPPGEPLAEIVEAVALRKGKPSPLSVTANGRIDVDPTGRHVLVLRVSGPRESMDSRGRRDGPDALDVTVRVRFAGAVTPR